MAVVAARKPSLTLVAAAMAGMILAASPQAASANAISSISASATSAYAALDAGQRAIADEIVARINDARAAALAPGHSVTVYASDGVEVRFENRGGTLTLTAGDGSEFFGICHAAAMSAVYAIGAAAFAAAAAVGGITVLGIAISAQAANALSIALAAGSGLSALVAAYIC